MIKVDGPARAHTVLKPSPSLTAMYLSNPAVLTSPSIMLQCESITPRLSTEIEQENISAFCAEIKYKYHYNCTCMVANK